MHNGSEKMRPVKLGRIIEICTLASRVKMLDVETVTRELRVTRNRARDLLFELSRIDALDCVNGMYQANLNTDQIMESFENEDWGRFRSYLYGHSRFYRTFVDLLKELSGKTNGVTLGLLAAKAREENLPLNQMTVDVLANWCERLGVLQRNLYTRHIFLVTDSIIPEEKFEEALRSCYDGLNTRPSPVLRLTYVEIPRLREETCERLRIGRRCFDESFLKIYEKSRGTIELSGAPFVSAAKKSPLTIRMIRPTIREGVLSPQLDLSREREGIEIRGRLYYYIAIHRAPT